MNLEKIRYQDLNSRQKESYNFFKVAGILAEYGFNSIRLSDDWESADFIAVHIDGESDLKIQLKSRLTFSKKYMGKNLYVCFPDNGDWYLYPHDELLEIILEKTTLNNSKSWIDGGVYSFPRLSKQLQEILENHKI